jgi:hypothetical protein
MAIEGNKIVVQQFLTYDAATPQTIMALLEKFLNRAESLRKRLGEFKISVWAIDTSDHPLGFVVRP